MNNSVEHKDRWITLCPAIQDITATLDLATVAARLAAHARALLKADYGLVYLLAEAEPPSQLVEVAGAAADWDITRYLGMLLCFEDDLLGTVMRSGVGQSVAQTAEVAQLLRLPDLPSPPTSLLCAPLIHNNEVIGVVVTARSMPAPPFDADDLDLLLSLTSLTAIAVLHARLYRAEQDNTAALRRALAEQQEHDRMKDQVLQNVSHEFRAPLTIARGYIELLECDIDLLPPDHRDVISVVGRRLRMLSELVRDINLVLHAKSPTVQYEPVDLAALVRSAAKDFYHAAENAVLTLEIAVALEYAWVRGNSVQLWRVLDNLISNALKFTPPGGRIDVRLWQNGDRIQLEVADTGVGILPEKIPHIFERFYTGEGCDRWHAADSSMGLGLTMVKEIVEAHGGTVSVTSVVRQGSTFTVSLPVLEIEDRS